jgi:hypothetical protein
MQRVNHETVQSRHMLPLSSGEPEFAVFPVALFLFAGLIAAPMLHAQAQPELSRILARLDRLEQENRALSEEVRALKLRLDGADRTVSTPAPVPDGQTTTVEQRLNIQERRVEEQAESKVEASQKFPIRLTGMLLFNSFINSKQSGGSDYPVVAGPTGARRTGATVRQSIIGLDFRGPESVLGGHVRGSIFMDFFAGANNSAMRIRTASIELGWKSRSVTVGLEKPIFNPREPSSLAQVGVSPLTGTGNLWLWLPQARFQQDLKFTGRTGIRAQMGVVQTRESAPYAGSAFNGPLEGSRPGLEGRYEFFHQLDDERKVEVAPGFHRSTTHVAGGSAPSSLFSLDWFMNPWRRLEFSGAFYTGQNVAPLGNGYLQGYTVYGSVDPVHSTGGWGQFKVRLAPRLDLHLFSGQQDDTDSDLRAGRIGKNLLYGGNLFFRLAPNVLLGVETTQLRTKYIGQGTRINNHYDLALAYYF